MGEQERSSDWVVVRDIGGRVSCSVKGLLGSIEETGQMNNLVIGRVSVTDEGEEMEMDDIAIVMKEIKEVGIKSGKLEQDITIKFLRVMMVVVGREKLRVKDSGVLPFIIV